MKTILSEAEALIYGDRQEAYGSALKSFGRIAAIWSILLCLCMDALKTVRLLNQPGDRDSIVDKAGYAGCYEKIQNERDAELPTLGSLRGFMGPSDNCQAANQMENLAATYLKKKSP